MDKKQQMSESMRVAILLAIVGGFFDAYTYTCRGGVFANAQTGNIVQVGMALAKADMMKTLSFLIPIISFIGGGEIFVLLVSPPHAGGGAGWGPPAPPTSYGGGVTEA